MQIRVRLTIPDPRPDDAGSRVRVTVVDTSRADALHPAVAEATTVLDAPGAHVELTIDVPDATLRPGHRYALQAHVDRRGTGDLEPGDLIITEHVPVPPADAPAPAPVHARLTRI